MSTHLWFIEHRTAFVTRSLSPEEEESFTVHLRGCDECRAAVAGLERELAWLPMGAEPVALRPGLQRQLVETALGVRRRRMLAPLLAMAAGLVLALGAATWAALRVRRVEQAALAERNQLIHQLAMVRDTLEITRTADKVRHASIQMGDQRGGMVIFADERSHRWNVVVYGVAAPSAGEKLQFWFITRTGMVRGVEIKATPKAPAFLTLPMPPTGGPVMGAALTMEAEGSSSAKPEGKELAHVMM